MRIGIKEPKITVMDENRQRSKCNFLYVTKPTYGTQSDIGLTADKDQITYNLSKALKGKVDLVGNAAGGYSDNTILIIVSTDAGNVTSGYLRL